MAQAFATDERVTREKKVLVGPPQPVKVTIWHKETKKPLEVYAADAREILAQPDSEYQDVEPGKENVKPAPLDHSVKEVIGTSSTPTIIESPLRAEAAAKAPAADKK